MWKVGFPFRVAWCILAAFLLRKLRRPLGQVRWPAVSPRPRPPAPEVRSLIGWVDRVIARLNTGHPCFYRSYTLVHVLRRRGVPVVVNVGMRGLGPDAKKEGHCWLTLDGRVLAERDDPHALYPVELGRKDPDICYWVGSSA